MENHFLDSSALVKCYVREKGSDWVRTVLAPPPSGPSFISVLTPIEVVAALARRERTGSIPVGETAAGIAHLRGALNETLQPLEVSPESVDLGMELARRHSLKGADALQLATAMLVAQERRILGLSSLILVSADGELNLAARAEGLIVENPNEHP